MNYILNYLHVLLLFSVVYLFYLKYFALHSPRESIKSGDGIQKDFDKYLGLGLGRYYFTSRASLTKLFVNVVPSSSTVLVMVVSGIGGS